MRPNIIFYFSDQQRHDTLGCYGQSLPVSPFLDTLAAEGTLFQNAFTCQPVCGPARACLQTGMYATETGCFRNDKMLPADVRTLASYFNASGYETAYVGKWHLASETERGVDNSISPVPPELRGGYKDYWMAADVLEFTSHGYDGHLFDADGRRRDFTGYRADCVSDFAMDYIRNKESDAPFFMFISQIEPHHQNDRKRYEGPDGSKEQFRDFETPGDLVGTAGDWRESYPDYLGQCRSLDDNVARLVGALKAKGMWENTILIYTSDHGSHFKTRNSEYKRACHDGCIHIPMIAYGGVFTGGKNVDALVSLMDIPATLLDCAGIPVPEQFRGRSLCDAVGGAADWPQEVFLQISESQVGRCVRTRDWKYSVRAEADGWNESCADVYYEDFLYDLNADPHERDNLVASEAHEDVREALAETLIRRMREAGEGAPRILPYAARESQNKYQGRGTI